MGVGLELLGGGGTSDGAVEELREEIAPLAQELSGNSKAEVPSVFAVNAGIAAVAPSDVILAADLAAINSNAALQNVTGLFFEIGSSATEVWEIEGSLIVESANVEMDIALGWTLPEGVTGWWGGVGNPASTNDWGAVAKATTPLQLAAIATKLEFGSAAAGVFGLEFKARITGGGHAGTVQLRYAQAASNAGNLKILKLSKIRPRKLVP